jgi:hypothetical protein
MRWPRHLRSSTLTTPLPPRSGYRAIAILDEGLLIEQPVGQKQPGRDARDCNLAALRLDRSLVRGVADLLPPGKVFDNNENMDLSSCSYLEESREEIL